MLYLGCQHIEKPEMVSTGLVRVRRALDNHAVVIRASVFLRVRAALRGSGKGCRGKAHSDLLLSAIHQTVPTYATYPNLAWQGTGFSDLQSRNYSNYESDGRQKWNAHFLKNLGKPPPPVFRIWPGSIRSLRAFQSWQSVSVINVPAVEPGDPKAFRSRELACSQAHANALRQFLQTGAPHGVIIEDDVVLFHRNWLSFTEYDYFQPFASNRDETPGADFSIREGVLPKFGTQAYLASRRFAEAYIPLLESGGVADHVNLDAASGLRVGSYPSNGVIHDTSAPSMISEERRRGYQRIFDEAEIETEGAGAVMNFESKRVIERPRGVSFCVLCKGRRSHLERTLRRNLDAIQGKDAEIVVVDYKSPDGLAEWISKEFQNEMASGLLRFCELQEMRLFSIPIGKNFAHRLATKEFLVNLDADNFVGDIWMGTQSVNGEEMLVCNEYGRGTFGRIGLWRTHFEELNGYDESFEPAGRHDADLQERAQLLGLRKLHWPCSEPALQHDKAATLSFLGGGTNGDWVEMERRNALLSKVNLEVGKSRANQDGMTSAAFRLNFREIIQLPGRRKIVFGLTNSNSGARHRFSWLHQVATFARHFGFEVHYLWGVTRGVGHCRWEELFGPIDGIQITNASERKIKELERVGKAGDTIERNGRSFKAVRERALLGDQMFAFDLKSSYALFEQIPVAARAKPQLFVPPSEPLRMEINDLIVKYAISERTGIRIRVTESPTDKRTPRRLKTELDSCLAPLLKLPTTMPVFVVTDSEYIQQALLRHFESAVCLSKEFGLVQNGSRYVRRGDKHAMKTFVKEAFCLCACCKVINIGTFFNDHAARTWNPPYETRAAS
jgi:hypothetical protein